MPPYIRVYQEWRDNVANQVWASSPTLTFSPPVAGQVTYTASFKKEYDITFQNSLLGAQGGIVKISGVQQNAPYVAHVRQDNSVNVEAPYQVINGIEYIFSNWTNNRDANVVYSAQTSFTPTDHTIYTANFTARPLAPANITLGGQDYVHITWTEHPHTSVTQYQIWRTVKPYNQNPLPPQLVTTVNRGTTYCDDYEYAPIYGYHPYLLGYDVRSYFSLNGATSFPWWYHVYGIILPKRGTSATPTSYSVNAYPNPFNPSTEIGFDLPEDGYVSLRVIDILGREVASLASEAVPAGSYSTTWNAGTASSGIYFAHIRVQDSSGKTRFSRISKLVLMK